MHAPASRGSARQPEIARSPASELHRLEAVEALLRAQATAHIVELGRVREQITTLRVSMTAEQLQRYETLSVVFELDRISNVRGGR